MEAANAASREPAMAGSAVGPQPRSGSDSLIWPIAVVGGSIAVAAIGALGLYSMGPPRPAGFNTGAVTADVALAEPAAPPRTIDPLPSGRSTAPLGPLVSDTTPAFATTSTLGTTTLSPTTLGTTTLSTTTLSTKALNQQNEPNLDPPIEDPAQRVPGEETADASSLARYAIYETPDWTGEPIASFVSIAGHLISSASALGDREFVYVRVGARFHKASVAATDALSDVAIVLPTESDNEIVLPTADLAPELTSSELAVFVGYGASDASPDRSTGTAPNPATSVPSGSTYPTDSPGQTMSNRFVYSPIKTHIRRSAEMSGAPLRDKDGHVLGMVVDGIGQYVFAIPIDRVVSAAESLITRGIGSLSWIGVDVVSTDGGVEILSIAEQSPFAGLLQPGDLILEADGELVRNRDHLTHLVREAGVGTTVQISCQRPDGRQEIEIVIAEAPPVEQPAANQ